MKVQKKTIRGNKYWVVLEDNKILDKIKVSKTKLSKNELEHKFKNTNSLDSNILYKEVYKTGTIREDKKIKTNKNDQIFLKANVVIDGKRVSVYGFSKKGGTEEQAKKMLKAELVRLGRLTYEDNIDKIKIKSSGYLGFKIKK